MELPALLFAGGLGVVGLAVAALGGRELWFAWRIYRGEPLAVYELPNELGPVEVQGVAQPEEGTVESPISGSTCLICEWEIQEYRTSTVGDGTDTYWKTLDEGLLGGPFRLADDTASCRVEPAGSVRHLEAQTVTVPGGTSLPDRLADLVAGNQNVTAQDETVDLGVTELRLGNDQRFIERRLDPGEECYVYGRAHYDGEAGRRGGEINVVIDGDGVRRFLIADGRERGVAWDVAKLGVVPLVIGFGLVGLAVLAV